MYKAGLSLRMINRERMVKDRRHEGQVRGSKGMEGEETV